MKRILTTTLILCAAFFANAQQGFHTISAGAEVALPLGDFGTAYGIGFGATGKAFDGITEQGDITGTSGYIHFGMKAKSESIIRSQERREGIECGSKCIYWWSPY